MQNFIIENAKRYIAEIFQDNADGHDARHSLRVYRNALQIAEKHPECDRLVVSLAALLHDVDDHKLFHTENNANARTFLHGQHVEPETIERICAVVNAVSFSKNRGKRPDTIEGMIVQDADRLDAIGAVGVARTFAFGGRNGRPLESSVQHFYDKLLLLKDEMNTEEAKAIANARHSYMECFLAELQLELDGKNNIIKGDFNMDIMEIMQSRHSVRQYLDKPIPQVIRGELDAFAAQCNIDGKLNIQLIYDEPNCFNSRMAHYGKFENVKNYIAMVGAKAPDLEERCGYYGEKLVLKAQALGLNTCWVALTHGKSTAVVSSGEKEVIIIALGYGKTQGVTRKSKKAADVSNLSPDAPEWFARGVEAALIAPTAINQQKFKFERQGDEVAARTSGLGTNLKVDLGIVKCHFELGAGADNFRWKK